MESGIVTIHKSKFYYKVVNPEKPDSILLIHGFRGSHGGLLDLSKHLKDFRVILIDLPGHGLSEPMQETHTLKNYAEFLLDFLAKLEKLPFAIVGHSYGALIALIMTARLDRGLGGVRPSKLVLINPPMHIGGLKGWLGNLFFKLSKILPPSLQKAWMSSKIIDRISAEIFIKTRNQSKKKRLVKSGRNNLKHTNPKVVLESFDSFKNTNMEPTLKLIKAQTLIIRGEKDPLSGNRIEDWIKTIPKSKLITIKKYGHLTPLEVPDRVARILKDFLA